jgi:hypothetical protein
METGGVKCWGWNEYGQLGDGTRQLRRSPVDVLGLSSGVTAVSAGSDHTCALLETGQVMCWGNNYDGQLGHDSTIRMSPEPVDVRELPDGVVGISAGGGASCAVLESGELKCWGCNVTSQLGFGWPHRRGVPTDLAGFTQEAAAVSAGAYHTCLVSDSGAVRPDRHGLLQLQPAAHRDPRSAFGRGRSLNGIQPLVRPA